MTHSNNFPVTILVVEDERLIMEDIVYSLRAQGWNIIEATSADQAVGYLRGSAPVDLVFSDIHTPGGMKGTDLAQWVKAYRPSIPVILTSSASVPITDDGIHWTEGHIPKPYSNDHIIERIKFHLNIE